MYETTWSVGGHDIDISSEYIGGRSAPWMAGNDNYNIITVSVDGGEPQEFDAWGSIRDPQFDDEYSIRNIFQNICDEVLHAIWEDWDDVVYGLEGARVVEVIDGMREEAEKFKELGIYDEDLLLEIVNDEEWH